MRLSLCFEFHTVWFAALDIIALQAPIWIVQAYMQSSGFRPLNISVVIVKFWFVHLSRGENFGSRSLNIIHM